MAGRFGILSPLLWGALSMAATLLTVLAYGVDSYNISERCYYLVQGFAGSKVAVPENLGDIDANRSLIPLGWSCTWTYEDQTTVLHPFTTGIVTTLAVITIVLLAITALVGLVRRSGERVDLP